MDSPLGGGDLVTQQLQIGSTLTTSQDSGYLQAGFGPLLPVSQRNFRISVGTVGTVAYIDDVRYSRGSAGAVPEPATWAMLITGFGLAGAVARRRKLAFA